MPNILISGAGSGLGYQLCSEYLKQNASLENSAGSKNTIYAIDKNFSETIENLRAIDPSHIQFYTLDISDPDAVSSLCSEFDIQNICLHLVIHSAGMRGLCTHKVDIKSNEDVAKSETLEVMDKETMMKTFEVNVVGTFLLLRGLVPSLRRAAAQVMPGGLVLPRVLIMGSRMGSISHNTSSGGGYAYRASKAALNAVVRSLVNDVPEVVWTVCHPGRVKTGLVSITEEGAMPVQQCVEDLLPLLQRLDKQHSGRFVDRFGNDIPW